MDLTILGCTAGMPGGGRPSAGYLVRDGRTAVLLDAGPGVATALTRHLEASELDAVFISHLHTDHIYDVLPIGKMLMASRTRYGSSDEALFEGAARVPLYVPQGGGEKLAALAALFPVSTQPWLDRPFELAFEVIEYTPNLRFAVGAMEGRVAELRHAATNCAIRLERGDASLVYTGDTGVTTELPAFARGAGTLLAECSLEQTDTTTHGHLSASDAARAASEAGVAQLVLTHYPHLGSTELRRRIDQAAAIFPGAVDLAAPDRTFAVRRPATTVLADS